MVSIIESQYDINYYASLFITIMSLLEFQADNTEEYNKLLRTCYYIKHNKFEVAGSENFGKWKCKVCINDVFIKRYKAKARRKTPRF